MRLGSRKRVCIRCSYSGKRRFSAILLLILIFFIIIGAGLYFLKTIRPVMAELASSKARFLVMDAVDETVEEVLQRENVSYTDIITLEKDAQGRICAVQSNLLGVSRLKAKLALAIQQKIAEVSETQLVFPAGSLSGCDFLAGVGPRISARFMPYGDAQTEFVSHFESAGINQTRLRVELSVKTNLALLMPTLHTACTVEDTVPILQTIIVGEVPESYFDVDREGGSAAGDALEFAPKQ